MTTARMDATLAETLLAELTLQQRQVLALYYAEELTELEISAVLDISPEQVLQELQELRCRTQVALAERLQDLPTAV